MDKFIWRKRIIRRTTVVLLFICLCTVLTYLKNYHFLNLRPIYPNPRSAIQKPSAFSASACPSSISANSITPIKGTRYLMVSAFSEDDANKNIRIISIMNRSHYEQFTCIFCCGKHGLSISPVILDKHIDHFGFPYLTTDAFCTVESTCNATHVTISSPENLLEIQSHMYLPINKFLTPEREFDVDFTLCITCLFGGYNNVLQFVQTIETYRLLGVEKVVVYNTSCGPELETVLQSYKEEGILEIIPWPIHHFLKPSKGWKYDLDPGDVHYYGQQATIDDCICRNKQRSRYVVLSDADEIIMPYKHSSLHQLMRELQDRNPQAGTFIFETHVFPETVSNEHDKFDLQQWRHVPGVNILKHTYREPLQWFVNNPSKMIINPRKVQQASVHSVLKSTGEILDIPNSLAIVMHTRVTKQPGLKIMKLIRDERLLEYTNRLIPKVNQVLQKAGLLN